MRAIKSTSKYRFIKTVLDVEKDVSLRLVLVRVSTFPCGNTGVLQEFRTQSADTQFHYHHRAPPSPLGLMFRSMKSIQLLEQFIHE